MRVSNRYSWYNVQLLKAVKLFGSFFENFNASVLLLNGEFLLFQLRGFFKFSILNF